MMNQDESLSFGELLKAFRTRGRLTQQQLAEALGLRRHTIIRWEQGDFLPKTRTLVLELARHLHLDESATRRLLEASLITLAPHWSVPLPRNPYFTGREEALSALHTQLGIDRAGPLTQSSALYGLGGAGKTQIALEYAYRYALDYSAVFWIHAETYEQISASFCQLAETLHLLQCQDKDQDALVTAVKRWLSTHSQWLLIWDDIEELALLDRFVPPRREGAILLTTRSPALGTFAQGIELLPMTQEEGMLLLLRRGKALPVEASNEAMCQLNGSAPEQYMAAKELVAALGGLPLALDQAGAYIEEAQCGLPAYLEIFRRRRAALLQERGKQARDHPASVAATFRLDYAAMVKRHPAAGNLLQVCALLGDDAIPEELFIQGANHLGKLLQAACADELEWNRLLAAASSSSLLQRQPERHTLSVHRLVQVILQKEMGEEKSVEIRRRLIRALGSLFPDVTYDNWQQCERLLPHALLVAAASSEQTEDQELAALLQKVADYLRQRAQYQQARVCYERALRIRERILDPSIPK